MRYALWTILTVSFYLSSAQDKNYFSVSYTPGFLLAHRADIKNLAAHNSGLEVSFEQERKHSEWGQHYAHPTIGFGLLYYNLGREETGHAIGAMSHVKLKLFDVGGTRLNFRMGAGLAYLTKKFDVYDNRRNQAIGSHLNGSMQFGLVGHNKLRQNRDYLEYGVSISHYSNAAFKVPNLGYNMPSFTLRYGFGVGAVSYANVDTSVALSGMEYRVTAIYGKKQRNFAHPVDFYNYGLQFRGIRNVSRAKAWRFGIDYTLDKTYKFSENHLVALDSISLIDKSEIAVAGGFQWSFGRADILAEIGAYVYKPAVLKNALSQRMGLVYRINEHMSAQGTLRFHRGVADFFEMGLGYTL
ncbi:MAG: acyloxyacyl hydrolase [Bacteroidia bacterium]